MYENGTMLSVGQRKTKPTLRVNLSPREPKTSKEWCREYRKQLKANKEEYKLYLKSETARIKSYRENRQSEAAKDRNRELQRVRQKKYRENLKASGKCVKKPATRKSEEQRREKWREQKRKQRQNMSRQKKNAINAKRRNKENARKIQPEAVVNSITDNMLTADTTLTANTTPAFKTAKSRQKQKLLECMNAMPNNPALKAAAIEAAINHTSPNTKRNIQEKLEISSPKTKAKKRLALDVTESVNSVYTALRLKRSQKDIRMRRILACAMKVKISSYKAVGVSRKLAKRIDRSSQNGWEDARKKRKDAISEVSKSTITQFYDTASKAIPDVRGVIKQGGEYHGRKILENSLKSTYDRYAREVEKPVSYGTFVRERPGHILPYTSHRFRECLCEYCLNIDLLLKSINTVTQTTGKDCSISDRYAASRLTLCPKEDGLYKKVCLDRECDKCGVSKLRAHLLPILDINTIHTPVTWWQWEMGGNRRLEKIKKESVTEGLVEAFELKMGMLSKHLFNAKWQYEQYKVISNNPPSNTAVLCMDYAENFTCKAQDAPQGFHWNNVQCTIHSVVASYNCQECEEVPKTVTDSIVVISDDLKHDYHGVQHFVELTINLLKEESGNSLTNFIQFSDGAPTQYKNKVNFVNCSFSEPDMGVKTEKHFFGSRHGKGPCDREIGVLKKSAKAAVAAGGETILSPKEFFDFCQKNLALPKEGGLQHVHSRRRFLFVGKNEINRNNRQRMNVKPLKDTRKYHSIRGIEPFVISARERSCFCASCYGDSQNPCLNEDITGPWVVENLTVNQHSNRRNAVGTGIRRGFQDTGGVGRGRVRGRGRGGGRGRGRGGGRDRGRGRGSGRGMEARILRESESSEESKESSSDYDSSSSEEQSLSDFEEDNLDSNVVNTDEDSVVDNSNTEESSFDGNLDISGLTGILESLDPQDHDILDSPIYMCPFAEWGKDHVEPVQQPEISKATQQPELDIHPLEQSVHLPELSVHQMEEEDHVEPVQQPEISKATQQLELDIHPLEQSVHLPELSVHQMEEEDHVEPVQQPEISKATQQPELDIHSLEQSVHLPELSVHQPEDMPTRSTSFTEGTYIKVQHGTEIYPAVVDQWPWVHYFHHVRGHHGNWQLQETRHTILFEDVIDSLHPPDLEMRGQRFFYVFRDL